MAQIVFFIAAGIVKMSITAFNMRLANMGSRRWMYAHWTFFVLLSCYIIIAFFLNVFTCVPAITSFDAVAAGKLGDGFTCMPISELNTILRVFNITMDFCLLLVPLMVLWRVRIPWPKKTRLALLCGVGALACIGSVMSLVSKSRLKSDTNCKSSATSARFRDPIPMDTAWNWLIALAKRACTYCFETLLGRISVPACLSSKGNHTC